MSDSLSSLVSMFVIVGAKLPDLDLAVLSCADGRVGGLAGLVDSWDSVAGGREGVVDEQCGNGRGRFIGRWRSCNWHVWNSLTAFHWNRSGGCSALSTSVSFDVGFAWCVGLTELICGAHLWSPSVGQHNAFEHYWIWPKLAKAAASWLGFGFPTVKCHNLTHPAMDHLTHPHTKWMLHTQFRCLTIVLNQHLAIPHATHNSDECHALCCCSADIGEPWEMSGVSLGLAKWSPGELVKVPQWH